MTVTSHARPGPRGPVRRRAADAPDGTAPGPRSAYLFRRFPVTVVVAAPYLGLVLPMAVIGGSDVTGFIVWLVGIAVAATFVVELATGSRASADSWPARAARACAIPGLPTLTAVVVVVACSSRLVLAAAGFGSVEAQVRGSGATGLLVALASLLSAWPLIGAALTFACVVGGVAGRGRAQLALAALTVTELGYSFVAQRTAIAIAFLTPVVLLAVVLGVIRARTALLAYAATLLLWPTVFAARNSSRAATGIAVDQSVGALDRLRFDAQLGQVASFTVPVDLGQPGLGTALRYGLVPRLLDPDRPQISTGQLINQALGGSAASAYNFLAVGTAYLFYGAVGVVVLYAAVALLARGLWLGVPRTGPVALVLLVLTCALPLGWTATPPDSLIGYVQAVVASVPVLLALAFLRGRARASTQPASEPS